MHFRIKKTGNSNVISESMENYQKVKKSIKILTLSNNKFFRIAFALILWLQPGAVGALLSVEAFVLRSVLQAYYATDQHKYKHFGLSVSSRVVTVAALCINFSPLASAGKRLIFFKSGRPILMRALLYSQFCKLISLYYAF